MGFLDKVKEAGKAAAKGGIAMAAHSYGVVTGGKYNLCKISMNSTFDTLTFIKLTSIEGTHVIKDDIKTFTLCKGNDSTFFLEIIFNNGEKSDVMLKEDNVNNGALEVRYKSMATLVDALVKYVPEVTPENEQLARLIMSYGGK